MKYFVSVGGHTFEVAIEGGEARLNGEVVHAEIHAVGSGPLRLLRVEPQTELRQVNCPGPILNLQVGHNPN